LVRRIPLVWAEQASVIATATESTI
jgi:hypothetical protein